MPSHHIIRTEVALYCSRCGGSLALDISGAAGIYVKPCDGCLKDEFWKGRQKGLSTGYTEGHQDGYVEGQKAPKESE